MSQHYVKLDSPLSSAAFLLVKDNILTIYKSSTQKITAITNKNNEHNKNNNGNDDSNFDNNKTMYRKHVKGKLLSKPSYKVSNK